MFGVKDPIPRMWFKNLWAVMLALSVKPLGICPHVCVRTRSVIAIVPLTVSDIYQILNND